jgi:hypothetical protein
MRTKIRLRARKAGARTRRLRRACPHPGLHHIFGGFRLARPFHRDDELVHGVPFSARDCGGHALARPTFATRLESNCLPEKAVRCEPVSGPNSLLTGKVTGNFEKFGPSAPISHSIEQQIQRLAAKVLLIRLGGPGF